MLNTNEVFDMIYDVVFNSINGDSAYADQTVRQLADKLGDQATISEDQFDNALAELTNDNNQDFVDELIDNVVFDAIAVA